MQTQEQKRKRRLPPWFKVPFPGLKEYRKVLRLLSDLHLNTVCQAANCPNRGECFGNGTATFMILGDICSRNCRFCDIQNGEPSLPDKDETARVALAVQKLNLKHSVITSVTRDDLADGGAKYFNEVVRKIRQTSPNTTIELLIPDFKGSSAALEVVLKAEPDVLNHNIETVPRLYKTIRPQASYKRSLKLLKKASQFSDKIAIKSGLMVGLGESIAEITKVLQDLKESNCQIITIGQYLAPSSKHAAVHRYYHPAEFKTLKTLAKNLGFEMVFSNPLVRSSYQAKPLHKNKF